MCGKATVLGHCFKAGHWFERAEQDSACLAIRFAGDIEAEVLTVDGVDVGVAGWTEQDGVSRRGAAMGMGCRVRRIVVGTEVGFHLDDG